MSEHYEHNPNPQDHEDPVAGPTWLIGFIGVVLTIVITFGVTALYYGAQDEEIELKLYEPDYPEAVDARATQEAQLERLRWELRLEGEEEYRALVIPIDQAVELTLREYATP